MHVRKTMLLAFVFLIATVCANAQQDDLKEQQDYSFALGLFRDRNYHLAYEQFIVFARTYPASDLTIDAQYYVAESLYQMGKLTDAGIRFEEFRATYPLSKLADDAGFREGEVYYRQGQFQKAHDRFADVVKSFPEGNLAHEAAYWAGESAFKDAQYDRAIRYYRIAYDHYPKGRIRDYALFSIGFVQEKSGEYEAANSTYSDFLREQPNSILRATVYTRIAACLYQQRDYKEALSWLETLSDSPDPDNAAERLFLNAESHYQLGRFAEAETQYRSFVAAYPQHHRVRQVQYALGWALVEQKKFSEAIATFDDLGRGSDDIAEAARYRMGMALRLSGNVDAAKSVFLKMLELKPDGDYADNATFELGMTAFDEKNYLTALDHFIQVGKTFPKSDVLADAFHMSGESYLKLKKPHEASKAYAQAFTTKGASPAVRSNALFRYGFSLFEAEKFSESAGAFERFLKEFPSDARKPDALVWLGEAHFKTERYEDAIIVYNQALALTSDAALKQDALYGLGWSYYRAQRYPEAEKTLTALTTEFRAGKHDMDANIRLGDSQYAQKKYNDAIRTYRYASKMYPNNPFAPYALLQLGNAEHRAGDAAAGIATLKGLLTRYPKSEHADKAQFSLGWIYFQSKDFNVAIAEFQKLIDLYPSSQIIANAKYSIGDCLYNQGKYALAEQAYRRVLNEHPDSPLVADALDGIGQCLRMQGKNTEAANVKEEWLRANPKSPVADDVSFANAKKMFLDREYGDAILALESFVKTHPASARYSEAYYILGLAYKENGDLERSTNTLTSFIGKEPTSPFAVDARLTLADIALENQNVSQALAHYDELLSDKRSQNRIAEVSYKKGLAHLRNHDDEKAWTSFQRAIEEGRGNNFSELATIERARLKARKGNIDEAITDLTNIATTRADDIAAQAQYTIGDVLADAGNSVEAEKALLRVEYVFPEATLWIARAQLRLGNLYETQKNEDKAKRTYEKLIATFSGTPEAQEAAIRLGRLNP